MVETLTVLTKIYVDKNHALAAQRYGQRSVIRSLFKVYFREVIGKRPKLLPPFYADLARDFFCGNNIPNDVAARLVADAISSMTDLQAVRECHRLTGVSHDSILAPVII